MKPILIVLAGLVALGGCSASAPQPGDRGYASYQQRLAQAERMRQQQAASGQQAIADRDRRRQIDAQVRACENENQRARHSAQLYLQREYQARDCNALRRQLMNQR
jgi:hypothetical protein